MGKVLIIKNADFSVNSIGSLPDYYEDITSDLLNGFTSVISGTNQAKMYNSTYNPSNTLIASFFTLMTNSSTLYDTSEAGIEWFLPTGFKLRPWAHKKTSSISSDGIISNSFILKDSTKYISGTNSWVSSSEIYELLGVQQSTYPCYNGNIGLIAGGELTLQQAIEAGLKVRKIKE